MLSVGTVCLKTERMGWVERVRYMQGAVLMAAVLTGFIKRLLSAMNAAEIDIQVKTTSMV